MTLNEFLTTNGISQRQFARHIGVGQTAISRYSVGGRIPRPEILRRIMAATVNAVTANDFISPVGPIPPIPARALAGAQLSPAAPPSTARQCLPPQRDN